MTGGGEAEGSLTEQEVNIKYINCKESFEGIVGGIDLSIESSTLKSSEKFV